MNKNLMALTMGLMVAAVSATDAKATAFPSYILKCSDTYLDTGTFKTVATELEEIINPRAITQADVDSGIASPQFLGRTYASVNYVLAGSKVNAKVFAESPMLEITLPNGDRMFDGHNDGKFAQLGIFLTDLPLHLVTCGMERL